MRRMPKKESIKKSKKTEADVEERSSRRSRREEEEVPVKKAKKSSREEEEVPVKKAKKSPPVESDFDSKLNEIREALRENYREQRMLDKKLKELMTLHKKDIRLSRKGSSNSGKHSGFNKPEPVPEALSGLLGIEEEEMPRSQVTKLLYKYIKERGMYNEKNKRILEPSRRIRRIFGMEDDDEITFFNLQTWLKKLYVEEEQE